MKKCDYIVDTETKNCRLLAGFTIKEMAICLGVSSYKYVKMERMRTKSSNEIDVSCLFILRQLQNLTEQMKDVISATDEKNRLPIMIWWQKELAGVPCSDFEYRNKILLIKRMEDVNESRHGKRTASQ